MADKVRQIDYYYVFVSNQPGKGLEVLTKLKEEKVNLLSSTGFPVDGGRAQLVLVPEKPDHLLKAAQKAGITLSAKKEAFLVQGKDRFGAVAETFKKLADANVNVHASNATTSGGNYALIVWVKPRDVTAAAKALGL